MQLRVPSRGTTIPPAHDPESLLFATPDSVERRSLRHSGQSIKPQALPPLFDLPPSTPGVAHAVRKLLLQLLRKRRDLLRLKVGEVDSRVAEPA